MSEFLHPKYKVEYENGEMVDFVFPIHPKYKVEYENGEMVDFVFPNDPTHLPKRAIIRGKSITGLIDFWIIEPLNPIKGYPYTCFTLQHTYLRKAGSNESFLYERSGAEG